MAEGGGSGVKASQWGALRRLAFIDFRLYWERRINRGDLQEFFGISTPQASADLKAYRKLAPGNVEYDSSERAFVATESFEPVLSSKDASVYLQELASRHAGTLPEDICFIGSTPPFDAVPIPYRHVEPSTLIAILGAQRAAQALAIRYQSMTTENANWRVITPHAIGHDGLRFHARAYCHEREEFRDFVLSRVLEIGGSGPTEVDPSLDEDWHQMVTVRIAPHEGLSESQRCTVERDYGMSDGQRVIEVRRALLFYLLVRLRLDEFREMRTPRSQQIQVLNPQELHPELPPVYTHLR